MTGASFVVDLLVGVVAAGLAYGAYRLSGDMRWTLLVLGAVTAVFLWWRAGRHSPSDAGDSSSGPG